jgi:hypothetical protein
MRRIFLLLALIALAVGFQACAADAPAPTPPGGSGSTANSALQVRLFTNNANPPAGFCSTIQAVVTLNGANVPDGTGVIFSTDFGTFQQNGGALVSVVTTNGSALTALCSSAVGVAKVKASVTIGASTASSSIGISFQPSAQAVPFFAFCSPSSGPNTGGTSLTITGGNFFGDKTTTRVLFTAFGITREGVVQSVTATTLAVLTPAFPEAMSPSVPVDIAVIFGTNTGSPITIAVPNCFVYGTAASDQPTITAVLPSTGSNDGGTRVTILGSGFIPPIQVFFGSVEAAPPVSVTYNQIVVLAPAASGPGLGNLNATVGIRVRNTVSGKENTLASSFTFVTKLQLTGFSNTVQRVDFFFTPVTLFGNGFSSPVAVSLAGVPALISSVSSTELVVLPGGPLFAGCADIAGAIQVTNLSNGDTVSGGTFTYLVAVTAPVIDSVTPSTGGAFGGATISGFNLPVPASNVSVLFGTRVASIVSASSTSISVIIPDDAKTSPTCVPPDVPPAPEPVETVDVTVTNRTTKCKVTAPGSFTYLLPCH